MLLRAFLIFILLFTFQTAHCEVRFTQKDVRCLTETIYQEARGEGSVGMIAVGHTVINRLKAKWAKTVCGIIYQKNQFSWTSSKLAVASEPADKEARRLARLVAVRLLEGAHGEGLDVTNGATAFHSARLARRPSWTRKSKRVAKIGNHVFYILPSKEDKRVKSYSAQTLANL
jgi:spore germination cell wall hydrolase CwlJ-like protein